MVIGFEKNGVKYLAVSCNAKSNLVIKSLITKKENYPIRKINKFYKTAACVTESSYDLYHLVNVLENVEVDALNYDNLFDIVMPKLREMENKDRGIESDRFLHSTAIILTDHKFYTLANGGIVDKGDDVVLARFKDVPYITYEFLKIYKDLDYKETLIRLNEFLVKLNYENFLPFVVYKEDEDTIELVGDE